MAVDFPEIKIVSLNSLIMRIYREIWAKRAPSLILEPLANLQDLDLQQLRRPNSRIPCYQYLQAGFI